jgi:hypothetical protein
MLLTIAAQGVATRRELTVSPHGANEGIGTYHLLWYDCSSFCVFRVKMSYRTTCKISVGFIRGCFKEVIQCIDLHNLGRLKARQICCKHSASGNITSRFLNLSTIVAVTQLHALGTQQNRTTLKYEQRNPVTTARNLQQLATFYCWLRAAPRGWIPFVASSMQFANGY